MNSITRLDRMYKKFRVGTGRGRVSGAYERGEVKRIIAVLIALIHHLEDAYTHTHVHTHHSVSLFSSIDHVLESLPLTIGNVPPFLAFFFPAAVYDEVRVKRVS